MKGKLQAEHREAQGTSNAYPQERTMLGWMLTYPRISDQSKRAHAGDMTLRTQSEQAETCTEKEHRDILEKSGGLGIKERWLQKASVASPPF